MSFLLFPVSLARGFSVFFFLTSSGLQCPLPSHGAWLKFSATSLYLAMLPLSLFPGPLAIDCRLFLSVFFIFIFWYAHYSFWFAGFLSSKSGIYKVKENPRNSPPCCSKGPTFPSLSALFSPSFRVLLCFICYV